MGLSGSKCNAPAAPDQSSGGDVVRKNWSTRSSLLKPSCLRNRFDDDETQVSDYPGEENGNTASCPTETKTVSSSVSAEIYRKDIADQNDHPVCINSDIELDEWGESSFTHSVSREPDASRVLSSQSLNTPSSFLSRFSFYPGNLSCRLSRAKSLGSSNPYPTTSTSVTISNDEEQEDPSVSAVNRRIRSQGCEIFPTCFNSRPFRMRRGHCASNDLHFSPYGSGYSDHLQDNHRLNSRSDMVNSRGDARIDCTLNLFSPTHNSNTDGDGLRRAKRIATRERIERNIRFSRTLSVGRLRDRVLRRSLVPDLDLYRFQPDEEVSHTSQVTERQGSGDAPGDVISYGNDISLPVSSGNALSNMSISFYGAQNQEFEIPRARDIGYHDDLVHQSSFIDRRRRIRSQVRALQRLGSRLENNLSGHDRSCILSGQHLGGRCTCRIAAREVSSNDEATARASISRIGVLAEALFEVLDEIHQQSVALSTRHTASSSVASIPAPNQVVESLPLKIFSKLKRKPSDEAAQCYICLVEYENGDCMRILPCHHEFHRACVDKWLKEIHRVCPLCRGDICKLDSSTT